jgi:hypothetical protein
MTDLLDPKLKQWAQGRQAEFIDAVNLHGGVRAASKALGLSLDMVGRSIRGLKKRAALAGYSPGTDNMTSPIPDGFLIKRRSARFDRDGNAAGGWVISEPDKDLREEAMRAAADAMSAEIPRVDPIERPLTTAVQLCNLITLTDFHLGAMAWRMEGGADWDLRIAERTFLGAFEQMILGAPMARVCVVNIQGDFLHADGLMPVTPTSHHVLDADGRFSKVVAICIKLIRRAVDLALMRHDEVHLVIAEGNHDLASSLWLRHMFKALYENETRLQVNDSELPYYAFQHGKTMLAFHHGHMKKNDQLPGLFAAQFPVMWGQTKRRYCHTGHRHHVEEKEHAGMTVIQHPTLAARDAYAARGGWFAERAAACITYHDEWGQVARNMVCPEMLEAA